MDKLSKLLYNYFFMHEGNRLEHLLSKCGKSLITIAEESGIARQTLYNYFKNSDIPRKKLWAILDSAGIPRDSFFLKKEGISVPELNDPAAEYITLKERVRSLEQLILDKEIIISQQREIIELLKQKKK